MNSLPFPTNFHEEEQLLCRLYRVFGILESLEGALAGKRPRLACDLVGVFRILSRFSAAIEKLLDRPNRLKVWVDRQSACRRPPPRLDLLIRLLAVTRRASSSVVRVHDATAWEQEGKETCNCDLCGEAEELRWFLGRARRLLSAAELKRGQ